LNPVYPQISQIFADGIGVKGLEKLAVNWSQNHLNNLRNLRIIIRCFRITDAMTLNLVYPQISQIFADGIGVKALEKLAVNWSQNHLKNL